MKKVALLWLASLLLVVSTAGAQDRSVYWERWDVVIDNVDTTANRFDVTEIYDLTFDGTFRFGTAEIPTGRTEGINNVTVTEDGQPLRPGCNQERGTFCAQNTGGNLSITYVFFDPVTDGGKLIELSYTVNGALRIYEGGDQLWWDAVPEEHFGFPIGSSTVTVQLPEGYAPREGIDLIETYGAPGEIQVNGTRVVARATRGIGGDEGFSIRVQYPHNPDARVARWQASFDEQRAYEENTLPLVNAGVLGLSLLIVVGGVLLFFARWQTKGRDPQVGPVPEFLTEPPSALRPAVVGTLIDERADMRDVLSTLIDLAQRGYLVIEESQTEGFLGIGGSSRFTFKRTDKGIDDLRRFETRLINNIFGANLMERSLESLRNKFYTVIPQMQNDLYGEVVAEKLFDSKPDATRNTWGGVAVTVLGIGMMGFFVIGSSSSPVDSPLLVCLPMALLAVGLVGIGFANSMPAKTPAGALEAAKWRAFREYLQNLEKYSNVADTAAKFDEYLPYAVAFGLDRQWIQRFRRVDNMPIPPWYYPTYLGGPYRRGYYPGTPLNRPTLPSAPGLPGEIAQAGGGGLDDLSGGMARGLESLSTGLTTMLNSTSAVFTSRPQSSGSSGRWSSGGRSFSGGGFSGGGGSGGGSRGFG